MDKALAQASHMVTYARQQPRQKPEVIPFFDEATNTASYVVADPSSPCCVVIDSVLDFDNASGRISTRSADRIIEYVTQTKRQVVWQLETHAHADHLSAAPYLKERTGGSLGIGRGILEVQSQFGEIFNSPGLARDGREFDKLFSDGDSFMIGELNCQVLHVPGHTPADAAYVIGDAVFVGDTMFMPDAGTARADFPGGDAGQLYRSIRRLLSLPPQTRVFICHDYKAKGRDAFAWETTVADQRAGNIHVRDGIDEAEFVEMRTARDKTLSMPKLILPSVQVNMLGGRLPEPEGNGRRYLKIPIDSL
jgi:glyoxylase-like metal-dependent hydrolase (beta-lactamase superfamily II)